MNLEKNDPLSYGFYEIVCVVSERGFVLDFCLLVSIQLVQKASMNGVLHARSFL